MTFYTLVRGSGFPLQRNKSNFDSNRNYENNSSNNSFNNCDNNNRFSNHGSSVNEYRSFHEASQQLLLDVPFFMLNQTSNQTQDRASNFQQIPQTVFSVNCGEVRPKDEGVRVKISGKVVKRPRSQRRFLELKDIRGSTQLVASDDKPEIGMKFETIPADAYITVIGTVTLRPSHFVNKVSR